MMVWRMTILQYNNIMYHLHHRQTSLPIYRPVKKRDSITDTNLFMFVIVSVIAFHSDALITLIPALPVPAWVKLV